MSIEEYTKSIQETNAAIGNRIVGKAFLTKGDGTGTLVAGDRTSRLAYYWQPADGGLRSVGTAILADIFLYENNKSFEKIAVDLGYPPGDERLHILRRNISGNQGGGGLTQGEQKLNAAANPTNDRLGTLRAHPTKPTSLSIQVDGPYAYIQPSTGLLKFLTGSPTIDLTADIPGAANKNSLILVYFDPETGTLGTTATTAVTSPSGAVPFRAGYMPADFQTFIPTDVDPVIILYSYNGQTTFEEADFYRQYDARLSFVQGGGGASGVTGPASAVANDFATFNGTTGKIIKDSGLSFSTDGTLAANSDVIVASQKAIKSYVDAVATGLSPKHSVIAGSTAALPTNTYANGSSGVGATLTGVATGTLTVDGITIALNDRVLVKDEAAGSHNGIYLCTLAGAVGIAYVLTRSTDADTSAELIGAFVFVEAGTVNVSAGFVCTNSSAITIGTTAISFTQFSGAGSGAPTTATYITQTPDATLSAEQALSALATGYVKNTTGTGVLSVQTTPLPDADITNALTISGGTIDNTPIGAVSPNSGAFTALNLYIGGILGAFSHANSSGRIYTFPDAGFDLSVSGGATKILAQDASHVISARLLTLLDLPSIESLCQGRLTLVSGTPVPIADALAATTLYWTPYKGSLIALYDGSALWKLYHFSELSIAIPATTNTLYDVFCYDNAGTPTLELLAWNLPGSAAITGATNATPIVITSNGHGLSNDMLVTITGVGGNAAANGTFRVASAAANTFALTTLAGANVAGSGVYTSGGTWQRRDGQETRATALTTQDGVLVKTGATTRRYLGTIRTTTTSGQCEFGQINRLLYNYYNRIPYQTLIAGSASHTVTTALRAFNNDLAVRVYMISGWREDSFLIGAGGQIAPGSAGTNYLSLGLNSNTVSGVFEPINGGTASIQLLNAGANYALVPGCIWLQLLEASSTSTTFSNYHMTSMPTF